MAVKTGAIFNSLIFGGINSADYGIYITGEAVYNAPERAVEMVNVPGRNGAIVIDQGHWDNIRVTYPAGTFGKDQAEFREAVSAFRNAVLSQLGYQRLTDTYHPDEYRMAVYISGLEVDPTHYGSAGEFKLQFDCKPQRWLTEGEQEITVGEWSETESVTGTTVRIENPNGNLSLKSLNVAIEPVQNLNGYEHPWSGGSGKNKLQNQATSQTINGITWTVNSDGTVTANGTATAASSLTIWGGTSVTFEDAWEMTESMVLSCEVSGWSTPMHASCYNSLGQVANKAGNFINLSAGERIRRIYLYVPNGRTVNNVVFKPMLRASDSATGFEPYENICPISGHDSVDVIVSPTTTASDGETYTTSLGRTVYGGTLDVVSGVLTVDRAIVTYDGSSSSGWWSSSGTGYYQFMVSLSDAKNSVEAITNELEKIDISERGTKTGLVSYEADTTFRFCVNSSMGITTVNEFMTFLTSHNLQICYELAEPQTYQLTAQQIELLIGTNNIWSDGDVTVEYGQNPNALYNPTPYDASPLLMVEGYGTIGFNGYEIEIENAVMGEVELAQPISGGRATSLVTISTASSNNGDTIIFGTSTLAVSITGNGSLVTTGHSVPTITTNLGATLRTEDHVGFFDILIDIPALQLVQGTSRTITDTVTVSVDLKDLIDSQITRTVTHSFTVICEYNSTGSYYWMRSPTVRGDYVMSSDQNTGNYRGSITVDSTLSILGDPTYIDCDLGDAYMIKDGSYISLNSYIDLGSDLPVLASGNNELSVDNTITELKIVPRWWIL